MGWLTAREAELTVSQNHDSTGVKRLIAAFCRVNGLSTPRADFTDHYINLREGDIIDGTSW